MATRKMTGVSVTTRVVVVLLVGGLLGLPACSTGWYVQHPDDVNRLICDSKQGCGALGRDFEPIDDAERIQVKVPPPEPYRFGIGDVVNVSVPGQEEFIGFGETSKGDIVGIRVKEDGYLYLPYVEKVIAAGRTVLEVQAEVPGPPPRALPQGLREP